MPCLTCWLLRAPCMHQNVYFAGETLGINTQSFNKSLTNCTTQLFTLFYQEFLSQFIDEDGAHHVEETIVLGVTMFLLQQLVSHFGPVR